MLHSKDKKNENKFYFENHITIHYLSMRLKWFQNKICFYVAKTE